MGKKPAISAEKRAQIVGRSTMKLSERKLSSRQLKVSKTAVPNAIKKFQNKGSKRLGRPRISSIQDDRVYQESSKPISHKLC